MEAPLHRLVIMALGGVQLHGTTVVCSAFMRFAQLRVRVTNMASSTRDRAVPNRPAVIDGSRRDCTARRPAARRPGRGDPDAAPATRLIRRTRREAAAHRSSYPCQTRITPAILQVAAHPTATWTLQQLREVIGFEERYQPLLHDRDSIFASHLDESVHRLGVEVLKSPPRCQKANSICERFIGAVRRECLDWLIPLSESHLRSILGFGIAHYNAGRPHMALGPGVADPPLPPPSRLQTAQFSPSPRRILRGPSQIYSRRTASRIFPCADMCLTGFLRMTGDRTASDMYRKFTGPSS